MKRSFLFQLFIRIVLISLVLSTGWVLPANARGVVPLVNVINARVVGSNSQTELTFFDLGLSSPQSLPGPVSEVILRFNLPVEWQPTGLVDLTLNVSPFFSSLLPSENTGSISGLVGGDLEIYLNGDLLQVNTLQQSGEQSLLLEFDATLLKLPDRGSINELRIRWDGSASCQMNLLSNVTILPSSSIKFFYSEASNPISLNHFPVPFIIENSLNPVGLKLVLPDSPSLAEMRAGLIVAAGLGRLSRGTQAFEFVPMKEYQPNSTNSFNVIIIATNETITTIGMQFPGKESAIQAGQGEGIIRIFQPSTSNYGLLVSGDDAGIIKAAEVVSTNQVIAAGEGTTMIVSAVNPAAQASFSEDMTMQSLGVDNLLLSNQSGLVRSFDFYIPTGEQARPDASFDLIISHSQQLDYLSSGLLLKLNGLSIASLRLNDETSNQNLFRLILPSNLVHVGRNTLELVAVLNTRDLCTESDESIAWLVVSSSSQLHLPLESAATGSFTTKEFKDFPDLFLSSSDLNNVIFVLPATGMDGWQAAGKLAFELGSSLPGEAPLQLGLSWSDTLDPTLLEKDNLILVGKAADFKNLADKELFPSLVFNPDNTLGSASSLEIVSKPAAGEDVGYLAIRNLGSVSDRVLMAVLGNSRAGINFAAASVTDPQGGAGNFAVVVGEGVQASWLDQGIATGQVIKPSESAVELPSVSNAALLFKQGILVWVIPVMAALLIILLTLAIIEVRYYNRKD